MIILTIIGWLALLVSAFSVGVSGFALFAMSRAFGGRVPFVVWPMFAYTAGMLWVCATFSPFAVVLR